MASIKDLKKELIYTYGALLDQCYLVQMVFPDVDPQAAQALCDEIENAYTNSLSGLSRKGDSAASARARAVRKEFDATVEALAAKIEKLAENKTQPAAKPRKKSPAKAKSEEQAAAAE